MKIKSKDDAITDACVIEATRRKIIQVEDNRITYALNQQQSYNWNDPEEWVRAATIAWLVVERDYPSNRMRAEVRVPRRVPNDLADIVVYRDDVCNDPYLVVENKAAGQSEKDRKQWIEQLFGNANSLRSPLGLYDESGISILFDSAGHPAGERKSNQLGNRDALPKQYGDIPEFVYVAGTPNDIKALPVQVLETKTRRAHSAIWSGGKRDPLRSFDEWSKLLFAKVIDERTTPDGSARRFQIGTKETTAAVANRVHKLFEQACRDDPSIFVREAKIELPDAKVTDVVRILQEASFTRTDVDTVGAAFEQFFGSVFRGGLGQYFTMRQLARFTIGVLEIQPTDYVIDPTVGSGGFLLEVLLQTWHDIESKFKSNKTQMERLKSDFALQHVYGIEIHDIVSRICKINLLLHHDGHTNIEASRSCLDSVFTNPRLIPPQEKFTAVVGNPPFGTNIEEGDEDKLGSNSLAAFAVAEDRDKIDSEHVIVERSIELLEAGEGRFGLIIPDGLLNNQGESSNCPNVRRFLASRGKIEAIVSLPDHAFRKSGAQNKTSILFFRKFSKQEKRGFDKEFQKAKSNEQDDATAITTAIEEAGLDYRVFIAEANQVGYTPSGMRTELNDLYRSKDNDGLSTDQKGTILGEWRRFKKSQSNYPGSTSPDCMSVAFSDLWVAHSSNRLDPKYHLFARESDRPTPEGWVTLALSKVMRRRLEPLPDGTDVYAEFKVIRLSQTGEITERPAGKGNNPSQWMGEYFLNGPGAWFVAHAGDLVYSGIDLWKGCIAIVPENFNGALVTKEFPIYEVTDKRLDPTFLQCLLRTRYYQRAFRAITTGHSNRRRSQTPDFESLNISFPVSAKEQRKLIGQIQAARLKQQDASRLLKHEMNMLSNVIDGRGDEELAEIESEESVDE